MLPYQEEKKLNELLEDLFLGDDELFPDDIAVLEWSTDPILLSFYGNCCSYTYAAYGG